jgi:U6 snRNA-associated Sm-like protein LSm4
MNINLREVICTSKDGDKFRKMPECYIRGSTIKYLRIPDEVIDLVKEDVMAKSRNRQEVKGNRNQNQRGGGGNRNQNQNNRNFGGNRNQGGGQGQGGQKNQNQRNKK